MKKEFSDLTKSEKSVFTLQMVIDLSFSIGALIIFMAAVMIAAKGLPPGILHTSLFQYLLLGGIGFSVIAGFMFSYILKSHIKLYTILDLQKAEKTTKKIRDALKE